MGEPTRWVTEHGPEHPAWYIQRMRSLAAEGADLGGEARLVDAMVPRRARILDAGCGPGRVAAALAACGHTVVGVDADPALIDAARQDHPGPRFIVADLADLDLATHRETEPFDAVVCAGNVMPYLAPGSEPAVLEHIAAHLRPDGFLVTGFQTTRGYAVAAHDAHAAAAGLDFEHRFATWDLRPWAGDADFAVTVHRKP